MAKAIPPRLIAALALLCAGLVVNAFIAYYNISRLATSQEWVTHTLEVRQALGDIHIAVVRAETTERGFALTGAPAFLSEHAVTLNALESSTAAVRRRIADNEAQRSRLDRLEGRVKDASAWYAEVIKARQESGLAAAQALIGSGRGLTLTSSVRMLIEEMDQQENVLLRERTADAGGHLRATVGTLAALTVASLFLAVGLARVIRRELRERQRAEQALFSINQMLRSVLDTIPQRVVWKDLNSRYLGANRLFATDTGHHEPEEIVGKCDEDVLPGPDASAYRADDIEVMASGREKLNYEEPITRADGSNGWLETSKIPLRDMQGEVVGVLCTYQDITARKAAERELERQANFDTLTGLPNRNLLADRIDQAIAHAKRASGVFVVAMLDLDNFKLANNGHGHAFGDRLLVEAARRLQQMTRADDTVARYGGDEFVLVLSCKGDAQFATVLARVVEAMSQPFEVEGRSYFCTCSIGASTFPQDGLDAETLLSHSDAAMYQAKGAGRNRFEVFEPRLRKKIQERIVIERGLRVAMEQGQLLLHYQPQLNLRTGRVPGVEALARWEHPTDGMIPPSRFIPVAEQSGLIVPMGEWILKTACAQAKAWSDQNFGSLTVAVNLSALQFREKGFTDLVARTLRETGLPARHLELEITESLLMSEADEALSVLNELADMGICLSIDDFGTGYSSLSYLKRLPVHKLKIDQSFVRDVPGDADDVAIVRAIVSLSRALDLSVIAEGVETAEQADFLRDLGCDEIQGYYFSRPVPADQVVRILSADATA